jgi:LysM repeat protein
MFARALLIGVVAVLAWAVFARTSSGAAHEQVYVVKPTDTLWTIAARRYAGDPREGVWKLERRNHLDATTLRPGQRLVIP